MDSILAPIISVVRTLISILISFLTGIGVITPPATDDPITAKNTDDVRLTFTAVADSQVNAFLPNRIYLDAVLADMSNAATKQDTLVIAGDITENSLAEEWNIVYDLLGKYHTANSYVFATGNHDIRLRSNKQVTNRFTSYYNGFTGGELDKLYYAVEQNGYTFVVVGSDEQSLEKQVIHEEQLKWLDETIDHATKDGKPVFVIMHQPLKNTHGLPKLWNNGVGDSGHIGEQNDAIYDILNQYDNVILISGHLHTGFGQYTYEEIGNIKSVNLPSVGMKNADGDYCEFAIGYTVEVYDNEVVFRARDFGKGTYVPTYDMTIPLN